MNDAFRFVRRTRRLSRTALLFALMLAVSLASALPVSAQEFVRVEDGAREQLPATPFVAVAYGFIWLALLLYLLVVARGVGRVNKEIDDLRRRLDRSAPDAPSGR